MSKNKRKLTLNPCPNNIIARHCKTVVNNCLRCSRENFPTFKKNIPRNKKIKSIIFKLLLKTWYALTLL